MTPTFETKVRFLLVGYGYWGPNIARNIENSERLNLVGICDRAPERRSDASRLYKTVHICDDFRSIDPQSFDAVVVATPTASHFEISEYFLSLGKHVLVEKPLTARLSEAIHLVELAESKNLVLMVDHTFVYSDSVQFIKKAIDDGLLGKLNYFDSYRVNLGIFQPDVSVLWDLAVHDLAILRFLTKTIPRTVSSTGFIHKASKHQAIAMLTLEYEEQFFAHIAVSWLSPVKVRNILLSGENSTIVFNDLSSDEKIKIYDAGIDIADPSEARSALLSYRLGDIAVPRLRNMEPLKRELEHFADCIQLNAIPITSGRSSLAIIAILEAAQTSLELGGTPVQVCDLVDLN